MTKYAYCRALLIISSVSLLSACETLAPRVAFPPQSTVKPQASAESLPVTGSLFQASQFRPMFEDRRARLVGDTLTITINERLSSSQNNLTSANRTDSNSITFPTIQNLFGQNRDLKGIDATANSNKRFEGKGQSTASNLMSGTLTATVIEVLPNGNLVIAGEKQIGTNREVEVLRLSGVVNPANILANNTVSSVQIADARLEYRGKGALDSAQMMGWLSRFFLSFMPF